MRLLTMVKASSLVSTIILSLIVLTIGSMLMLAVYYYRFLQSKNYIDQRLVDDIQSSIQFVLNDRILMPYSFTDSLALFEGKPDSLTYTQQPWGCFPMAAVKVGYKDHYKTKAFLYGASRHLYDNSSLYVADHDRPLSVSGDTYIEGTVYLPKAGLRSGFFGQEGFLGKKLIEGEILTSGKTLPSLNPSFKEYFLQLERYVNDTITKFDVPDSDSILHSFDLPVRLIRLPRHGLLSGIILKGKLIIVSDSVINVEASAKLCDVILIAPFIHFKNHFAGTVQAFAMDSITVEPGCTLRYPSAIVGLGRNEVLGNTGSTITIHANSMIEGVAMAITGEGGSSIKPAIKIKKDGVVNGMVYNEGYCYLNGKVAGTVFTHFFFEQRGAMSMENILIDATIVPSRWMKDANYFSIFTRGYHQNVIKWLY